MHEEHVESGGIGLWETVEGLSARYGIRPWGALPPPLLLSLFFLPACSNFLIGRSVIGSECREKRLVYLNTHFGDGSQSSIKNRLKKLFKKLTESGTSCWGRRRRYNLRRPQTVWMSSTSNEIIHYQYFVVDFSSFSIPNKVKVLTIARSTLWFVSNCLLNFSIWSWLPDTR